MIIYPQQGCQPCKKVLKRGILDEKNSIFTHCAIHMCMCSNKLREKECIFLNPAVFLRYFHQKNSTKYCKKVTLGISAHTLRPHNSLIHSSWWIQIENIFWQSCELEVYRSLLPQKKNHKDKNVIGSIMFCFFRQHDSKQHLNNSRRIL